VQDSYFDLKEHNETFVTIQQGKDVALTGESLSQFIFQLSPSKVMIERRVYNIFDWMNEVGGFYGFLELAVKLILPYFQVWSLQKFLIQKLYSVRSISSNATLKSDEQVDRQQRLVDEALFHLRHRKKIRPPKDFVLVTICKRVISCICETVGVNRQKRFYKKAKQNLEQELDVIHFIKMSRLLHNSVKLLFSPRERQLMHMQAYRQVVSDNSSSGFNKEDHHTQLEKIADNCHKTNQRFDKREVLLL
jgi:hypothetical protein